MGLCAENVSGHPQSNVRLVKVNNRVLSFMKECFVCVNKDWFLSVSREKKDSLGKLNEKTKTQEQSCHSLAVV